MARSTELLIDLVQQYPVLYDVSHKDYKNKRVKNKAWDEICQIFGESNGETLKKQWKNLRDAYSKHLRSLKASPGQTTKHIDRYRTWPWASLMTFLRPHLEFDETQSNVQRDAEEGESYLWSVDANEEATQGTNTSQLDNTRQRARARNRRKRALAAFDQTQSQSHVNKVIHFISQNKEKEDETDLLFKAYAKKLKKMDMCRQAKVKFEIARIMMQAELEESDEMRSRSDTEQYVDIKYGGESETTIC